VLRYIINTGGYVVKTNYEIFKEMDKSYIDKLNLELKISYLLTDIILNSGKGTSYPKLRAV
jgi:hypothetical protein